MKNRIIIAALTMAVLIALAALPAKSQSQLNLPSNVTFSLNLKSADVTDVFRLIAEKYDLNIIVSPTVKGVISLRLSNVTLNEALTVILDAADATAEQTLNIIYINSKSDINKTDKRREDLITEIFSLNFIDANQLSMVLKDFLSPEGRVKLFSRTGEPGRAGIAKPPMLIITDYPQYVESARQIIEKLDTETPQVLIEAKIVETSKGLDEIIGTDWNMTASLTGSPVKVDTVYSKTGQISYGVLSMSGFQAVWQRLHQDKGINILQDARVSAMDNMTASIHVGESIPVGITSLSAGTGGSATIGTTGIQQWDVGVTLKVTPHVLDEGVIMMKIQPQISNVKGFTVLGSTGSNAPITVERSVDTNLMIKSGETIVIGGLVQDQEETRNNKVPVLGDLPVIGSAFRRKETITSKTNMVIFITATLMENKSSFGATQPAAKPQPAPEKTEPLGEFLEYK